MKKLLLFDMDNTITPSKDKISEQGIKILIKILQRYKISIVTGEDLLSVKKQLLDYIPIQYWHNIFVISENGMKIRQFQEKNKDWNSLLDYKFKINEDLVKNFITKLVISDLKISDFIEFEKRGNILVCKLVPDSALKEYKENFDPDGKKRLKVCEICKNKFENLDFYVAGRRSIDIMPSGVNKCCGINKLLEILDLQKRDVVFFGDSFSKFGNDVCVKNLGIDYFIVSNPEETYNLLQKFYLSN